MGQFKGKNKIKLSSDTTTLWICVTGIGLIQTDWSMAWPDLGGRENAVKKKDGVREEVMWCRKAVWKHIDKEVKSMGQHINQHKKGSLK